MRPRRRTHGLVVRELEGEVVIYDLERHRAHCLNRAAGLVFQHCDGKTSIEQLARLLQDELAAPADEQWALLALDRLSRAHLVEELPETSQRRAPSSRRELMRRAGLVSASLLPLVTTLVPPTPAQTAATCVSDCSGQPIGQPCGITCTGSCDVNGNCV